ncbi:YdcF family protein [Aphanothece sacrum]
MGPKHLLLVLLSSLGLWLGYKQLQSYFIQPEAIFVLGGHADRERFAAKLAKQYPNLPIWVSSGSPEGYVTKIFAKAGVKSDRLHLNYQAKDTVTNFTTLVNELKSQGVDSIYLVTSDTHMTRARIIGEIIFGTNGIILKPVGVHSHTSPEPLEKLLRDTGRSLLWLVTGKTGETLLHK